MKINVYCLPFAGGSSYSYREFQRYTPDFINIVPVELPGRGKRFSEPLLTDIGIMVEDIFNQIRGGTDKPYAIFGHSMGACLGYLLAVCVLREGLPRPLHLFFSGRGGPSVKYSQKLHLLPREEFFRELGEYGGTPEQVLKDDGLMELYEPILRADFQAVENYRHKQGRRLDVPVTVMLGLDENTTYEEALRWQEVTTKEINIAQFPGRHFFIFENLPAIGNLISGTLEMFSQELTR